jgi:hypothetical protein
LEDEWKSNSDIATAALCQFLRRTSSTRHVSCASAIYILDPLEAMSKEERAAHEAKWNSLEDQYLRATGKKEETEADRIEKKAKDERMEVLARKDAIPFLRNGFFQDAAIASRGDANVVVASSEHWNKPTLSEEQAAAIQFYVPPPSPPAPTGEDEKILKAVIRASSKYRISDAPMPESELGELETEISDLIGAGGSLSRSYAIHAAATRNDKPIVDMLLQMDPTIINTLDAQCHTALMGAAQSAAGRSTNNGIPETKVIDTLLSAGADRGIQDSFGLTAYGHFKMMRAEYHQSLNAMMGKSALSTGRVHPTHLAVERKLLPSSGPTASDLNGGMNENSGFVVFKEEHREPNAFRGYDEESFSDDYDY